MITIVAMMRYLFHLCFVVVNLCYVVGELDALYNVPNIGEFRLCKLHAPANVTIAYLGDAEVYLFWYPPQNLFHHKVVVNESEEGTVYNASVTDQKICFGSDSDASQASSSILPNMSYTVSPSTEKTNSTVNLVPMGNDKNISSPDSNGTDTGSGKGQQNTTTALPTTKSPSDVDGGVKAAPEAPEPKIGADPNPLYWQGHVLVPYRFANILRYSVSISAQGSDKITTTSVPGNVTEAHIQPLNASTSYTLIVSAVYQTNTVMNTTAVNFKTTEPPQDKVCRCDFHGTLGDNKTCSMTADRWCTCKQGYSGLFCEVCGAGFYRTAPNFPCYKCPCTHSAAGPSCHFIDGYLHCERCMPGYKGNLCHQCARGYYRYGQDNSCRKCMCNDNTSPRALTVCSFHTGGCQNCIYNTTGFFCHKCLKGYVGDPLHHKNCTLKADLPARSGFQPPPTGMIVGICIGTILVLCAIVGLIMYKKFWHYPRPRPFWTVELKEDHEGVNFNNVSDDDLHPIDFNIEDMDFYESQGGGYRGKGGSQKYSPLREQI